MTDFKTKEIGSPLIFILSAITLFVLTINYAQNGEILWPVVILMGGITFLFHSLNISVDDNNVYWSFGPGFWKKSIPIDQIQSVSVVSTKWYFGLGIRFIGQGWLYNVSFSNAVRISLHDGEHVFLATSQHESLAHVIQTQISKNVQKD